MVAQTVITNLEGLRFPDGPEEQDGDATYPDPHLRIEVPADLRGLFQNDLNIPMSENPLAALGLGGAPVLGEPLRQVAEGLREQLHTFLHSNMRRPSGFGLAAQTFEPPVITPLLTSFNAATEQLERIFKDRTESDPMSIQVKCAAHRMQSAIEAFLVSMNRMDVSEAVGEADLGGVLHQCIDLKGMLASTMQQMDMMNAEMKLAMMSQIAAMHNEQGPQERPSKRPSTRHSGGTRCGQARN